MYTSCKTMQTLQKTHTFPTFTPFIPAFTLSPSGRSSKASLSTTFFSPNPLSSEAPNLPSLIFNLASSAKGRPKRKDLAFNLSSAVVVVAVIGRVGVVVEVGVVTGAVIGVTIGKIIKIRLGLVSTLTGDLGGSTLGSVVAVTGVLFSFLLLI